MRNPDRFHIYLDLPPYLRQWLLASFGEGQDVVFPRSSVEHKVIGLYISTRPVDAPAERQSDGSTKIAIPHFAGRDPAYYNYLPPKAKSLLAKTITNRFDVDMWNSLHKVNLPGSLRKDAVEAWMELSGIEPTESNTIAVKQRLRRLRNMYNNRLRQRKYRKNFEKT